MNENPCQDVGKIFFQRRIQKRKFSEQHTLPESIDDSVTTVESNSHSAIQHQLHFFVRFFETREVESNEMR